MTSPNETILFARTIADRTDSEVLAFVTSMPVLLSKSTANDRVAHERIMYDLARRVRELAEVNRVGCGRVSCHYPQVVGLIPGVDVSIDGDVWPDSPYARHIARCPFHQGPATRRALAHTVDDTLLTIEVTAGPDPATMDAIRRVRAFQQQADEAGYGRPQPDSYEVRCGARNPRKDWTCDLGKGATHDRYRNGRHMTIVDGERYDWYDTADGRPPQ
ncbi:hypothetical protein SEA_VALENTINIPUFF_24 [Microbacterium phage ValentiniPuff]|uniref:Uncharacterized protein n=1 Tax=Microbacterium phage ValentiniPuff TaxID=2315705 RepID=A0A386KSL7_9CAUD|nr:hypothetical protein SEA_VALENTINIPUFF_24 [Microbacterium phage ValentiniPuff]